MAITFATPEEAAEIPMPPSSKPAKRYIASAIPHRNGKFLAQWAAPGMIPAYAQDRNYGPLLFDTVEEAEEEARFVLFAALNSRGRDSTKFERYRKLTGPEFAVALAEANLTPTFFAYLYGTAQERVLQWMDGADGVPHPAALLLEIMKRLPQAVDVAEAATERVTTQRKPPRAD